MQRHAGMLEHGTDLHGELLAALATLLEAVAERALGALGARLAANARQIINATADDAAMRARHAVHPHDAFQKLEGLGFIVEVRGRENGHRLAPMPSFLPHSVGFVNYVIAFSFAPNRYCSLFQRHIQADILAHGCSPIDAWARRPVVSPYLHLIGKQPPTSTP